MSTAPAVPISNLAQRAGYGYTAAGAGFRLYRYDYDAVTHRPVPTFVGWFATFADMVAA